MHKEKLVSKSLSSEVVTAVIAVFISFSPALSQVNLVPNPSFEGHIGCPNDGAWVRDGNVPPWIDVRGGGVRYFHECAVNEYSIPTNYMGFQNAKSGEAYLGLAFWANSSSLEGRFVGIQLTTPLIEGKEYNIQFYVSLTDSVWYAIKNIGVYFSEDQPPSSIDSLLSYEAQIGNEEDTFLNDKEKWIEVSGSYIANGGEGFLTIGNFDGHHNTDTLFVGGGTPPPGQPNYYQVALYYIDDVSVIEADTTTSISNMESASIRFYPNPALNNITIESKYLDQPGNIQIIDITGRKVMPQTKFSPPRTKVDVSRLSAGVYTVVLQNEKGIISRQKIAIQ